MINDPTFFQKELLGYVLKRVKEKSVAQDIVHDVFLKVQDKAVQIRDDRKALGWVYKITKNTIIDHFRSQSRVIRETELDWQSENQDLNLCVEQCLADKLSTLPQKYREAIELADMNGLSQLDLARHLHISYSGAKSRVQRARQMLKEAMEREYNIKLDNYGNVTRCENRGACNC